RGSRGRPERCRWRPPDRPPQGGRAVRRQWPGAARERRPLRHGRTGECDLNPASLRRRVRPRDLAAGRDAPRGTDQRRRRPDRGPGRSRDGGRGPGPADERPRPAPRAERSLDVDSGGPAGAPPPIHGLRVRPDEEEVDRRGGSAGWRRAPRHHRLFLATGSRRTSPRRHGDGDLLSAADARAVEFASSPKRELTFVRGSMATLWDDADHEYIDCGASFGGGNLGYCNPAIVEAITSPAQELINVRPSFGTDAKAGFLAQLH